MIWRHKWFLASLWDAVLQSLILSLLIRFILWYVDIMILLKLTLIISLKKMHSCPQTRLFYQCSKAKLLYCLNLFKDWGTSWLRRIGVHYLNWFLDKKAYLVLFENFVLFVKCFILLLFIISIDMLYRIVRQFLIQMGSQLSVQLGG